jgi:hypothetical protein
MIDNNGALQEYRTYEGRNTMRNVLMQLIFAALRHLPLKEIRGKPSLSQWLFPSVKASVGRRETFFAQVDCEEFAIQDGGGLRLPQRELPHHQGKELYRNCSLTTLLFTSILTQLWVFIKPSCCEDDGDRVNTCAALFLKLL